MKNPASRGDEGCGQQPEAIDLIDIIYFFPFAQDGNPHSVSSFFG